MRSAHMRVPPPAPPRWGIIGGMGPVASAEFLCTIYDGCRGLEQRAPAVFLDSDPRFPDRTRYLREGRQDLLARRLEQSLARLTRLGASHVVICCMTIHAVLPLVRERLRRRVIPLPDIILEEISARDDSHLLLCTNGTREARLFESSARWPLVRHKCVFPDARDQARVHQLIYDIKANDPASAPMTVLEPFLRKYRAGALVAGCTEMHVVSRRLMRAGTCRWIDPLTTIAQWMADGTRTRESTIRQAVLEGEGR